MRGDLDPDVRTGHHDRQHQLRREARATRRSSATSPACCPATRSASPASGSARSTGSSSTTRAWRWSSSRSTATARSPRATIARLRYRNIVGERYIALTEGAGTRGAARGGRDAPAAQTRNALDLTVLFNGFRPLFQALDPESVNTGRLRAHPDPAGRGRHRREPDARTASLTNTLADRDAVIGRVLDNLETVLETVDDRGTELGDLIVQLRRLSAGFAEDRQRHRRVARRHQRPDHRHGRPAQRGARPAARGHPGARRAGGHARRQQGDRRRRPAAAAQQARHASSAPRPTAPGSTSTCAASTAASCCRTGRDLLEARQFVNSAARCQREGGGNGPLGETR